MSLIKLLSLQVVALIFSTLSFAEPVNCLINEIANSPVKQICFAKGVQLKFGAGTQVVYKITHSEVKSAVEYRGMNAANLIKITLKAAGLNLPPVFLSIYNFHDFEESSVLVISDTPGFAFHSATSYPETISSVERTLR